MLELSNIVHRYPGADIPALQGIDLQLQPGQCLGLLGSNGAGKTTLGRMLAKKIGWSFVELNKEIEAQNGLSVAEIIAYASAAFTLLPGDVILTGTPAGVGRIVAGDRVDIAIDGLGVLSNPVMDA